MQGSFGDSGAQQLMAMSIDDMKAGSSLPDASRGQEGQEKSGKAIIALQQKGDNGTFVFHNGLVTAVGYCYKILIDLIPKIIDTERQVRVRKPDGSEISTVVNQEIVDPVTGKKTIKNDITTGRFRVVAKPAVAYATRRMEAVDGMVNLAQSAPMFVPILAPRIAKNLDFPEADEIAQEMKEMTQPQEPQQDPRAQMMADKHGMDMESKQIDIEKKKLELTKNQNQAMEQMASVAQQVTVNILQQLGIIPPLE
jgi:hypothetical protein